MYKSRRRKSKHIFTVEKSVGSKESCEHISGIYTGNELFMSSVS
jgi:hypothetical protein